MKAGWQLLTERFAGRIRLLWDVQTVNGTLRAYSVGGVVFIVHDYADGHGWQVYSPTTDDGRIPETLAACEARAANDPYEYRAPGTYNGGEVRR